MKNILIIDDDPSISNLVRDWVSELYPQVKISVKTDAKSGLIHYRENIDTDFIFLDYDLPDFNGIDFLKKMQEVRDRPRIPMIMLTGSESEEVAAESFKNGVTDYLPKKKLSRGQLKRSIQFSNAFIREFNNNIEARNDLKNSEERYRDLFDNANDIIIAFNTNGQIEYANAAWTNLIGRYSDRHDTGSLYEIIHPDSLNYFRAKISELYPTNDELNQVEIDVINANGHILTLEGNLNITGDFEQQLVRGIFRNITPRKMIEQELIQEKQRLEVTLRSIADAVICTDMDGNIEFMNPVAEELSGHALSDVQGKAYQDIIRLSFDSTQIRVPNLALNCLEKNTNLSIPDNVILHSKDDLKFLIKGSASPISSISGSTYGAVIVFQDITEQHKLLKTIQHQSQRDSLTGLYNRYEFDRKLTEAFNQTKNENLSHILCFLDLDNFKLVNDTVGHIAGDALLKQVAQVLESSLRSDDLLARLGGDEFAILLHRCPLHKGQEIAEKLIKNIQELKFTWEDKIYDLGLSIGLVEIDQQSESTTQILMHADIACYQAKDNGRNQVSVYSKESSNDPKRSQREILQAANLSTALHNDQFILYAQPITSTLSAGHAELLYEVLLRLKDRSGEILMPGSFIPLAERYHMMPQIDRWVIAKTINEYPKIFGTDSKAIVTINLSGHSLSDIGLLDFILDQINNASVPCENICFEITETAAISNITEARKLIMALKSQGCLVALDDFGSGLSSFKYLKHFPIDYLKIDGSFVTGIVFDDIDLSMVESIYSIGQKMNIKIVAEWVENKAIMRRLEEIGIDYIQGHFIGKPMPYTSAGQDYLRRYNPYGHLSIVN